MWKIKMNSKLLAGLRLACIFAVSAAMFAQPAPRARIVVVDSSGAPVNTAWRSMPEATPSSTPVRISDRNRNESAAIDMCLGYVDAQVAYFRSVRRDDGYLAFAAKILSSPGMHDGLYWDPREAGDESPIGPKFAAAAAAELDPSETRPLFGYYFKILSAQGPEAVGGARDYHVDGRLIAGFALVAWPAEYGVTGFRTFQVNHLGEVYARDSGPDTGRATLAMTAFAPDRTWTKVASAADSLENSR
jgi:hypothetical protein